MTDRHGEHFPDADVGVGGVGPTREAAFEEAARHALTVEGKGAAFTELKVHRDENGAWIAQCVVDV